MQITIFSNKKPILYILIIFIFKTILGTYFSQQGSEVSGFFVIPQMAGDTFSYYGALENLISTGKYEPFYRMPGVGLPYFVFRLFFSIQSSYILVIYFHIFLDSIATYMLARLIFKLSKSHFGFYLSLLLLTFNTYYSIFNIFLLSESIATSTLIITICLFYKSIENKISLPLVFVCGLFCTWCIFCRPIYLIVLLLIFIFYLYCSIRQNYKIVKTIKVLFVFLIPFLILDSLWVMKGFKYNKNIIPLEHNRYLLNEKSQKLEAYNFPKWKMSLVQFVQAFGGDIVDWNPDSEISWFNTIPDFKLKGKLDKLPNYAYCKYYNEDSLQEIKNYIQLIKSTTDQKLKDSLSNETYLKLSRYTNAYKNEKKAMYYLGSRILILKKFIVLNPTYNLYQKPFSELRIFEKAIKLFYYFIYYFYCLGFIIFLFMLLFLKNLRIFVPIVFITLYGILIYPILKLCEYRYIVPVFPFVIVLSVLPIIYFITFFYDGKNTLFGFKRSKSAGKS